MKQTIDYNQQAIDFLISTNTVLSFEYDGFKKHFPDDTQSRNVFNWTLTNNNGSITGKFGTSIFDSCKETPILNSAALIDIYIGLSVISPFEPAHKPNPTRLYISFTINTDCSILNKIKNDQLDISSIIPFHTASNVYNQFLKEYKKRPGGILSSLDSFLLYAQKKVNDKIVELEKKTVLLDKADTLITPSAYDLLSCLTKYNPGTFENFCGDLGYDTDSRKAENLYKAVLKEWEDISGLFSSDQIELLQDIN